METFFYRVQLYYCHQLVSDGRVRVDAFKEPSSLEVASTALEASCLPDIFQDRVLYQVSAWSARVVPLTGPFQGVPFSVQMVPLQG